MNINVITNIKDLRIKHIEAFKLLKENPSIIDKINLISAYTGYHIDKLRLVKVNDITKLFDKIVVVMLKYEEKELPLSINIDNKEFELVDDFSKLPVGWFIDCSSVNFEINPELLPAFCYIEKGMGYAEKDKHNNIINSLKDRADLFREHLPLTLHLDWTGFFLRIQKQYKSYCKATRKEKRNNKGFLSGKN